MHACTCHTQQIDAYTRHRREVGQDKGAVTLGQGDAREVETKRRGEGEDRCIYISPTPCVYSVTNE